MRYGSDQKARTKLRILGAAGKLFREGGFAATGVSSVMGAAGLTVGGFYAHFRSKEGLLAQALVHALKEIDGVWFTGLEDTTGEPFIREIVRRYASRQHRDNVSGGCPLPALLPEIARADPEVRDAFTTYIDDFTQEVSSRSGRSQDEVLAWTAMMIGGLLLSRAVSDPALSDRILNACRQLSKEAKHV